MDGILEKLVVEVIILKTFKTVTKFKIPKKDDIHKLLVDT